LDHPAYSGHFPGHPLVPGSMLLDLILASWDRPVPRVLSIKFHRRVMPGDELWLQFTATEGSAVRFSCTRLDQTVCSGVLVNEPTGP
jgi:3-hydroxymyristoyl/3-hydroxydecanoyl-(acyl carrier protein) dehydratase